MNWETRRKFRTPLAIVVLIVSLSLLPICSGWSNGGPSPSYPGWVQYGTHDLIADAAYYKVKDLNPDAVGYITEDVWHFRYCTELPDFKFQDWENHNYDFHKYGYKGGPPDKGAPGKVQELYEKNVNLLSQWIGQGMPQDSKLAEDARYNTALLAHYFSDICMPMHTDDTSDGSPEHTETTLVFPDGGTKRDSYHSLYESAIDYGVKQRIIEVYDIKPKRPPQYVADPYSHTLMYAQQSNGLSVVPATDPEHCLVGSYYWWFVENAKRNIDSKTSYLGIPGMSPELFAESLEQLELAATGIADLMHSMWADASARTTGEFNPYPYPPLYA